MNGHLMVFGKVKLRLPAQACSAVLDAEASRVTFLAHNGSILQELSLIGTAAKDAARKRVKAKPKKIRARRKA